jgi:hypothetical protein
MEVGKIIMALILTPCIFAVLLLIGTLCYGLLLEFGDDVLGIGFLLGWLILIFCIVYKLL